MRCVGTLKPTNRRTTKEELRVSAASGALWPSFLDRIGRGSPGRNHLRYSGQCSATHRAKSSKKLSAPKDMCRRYHSCQKLTGPDLRVSFEPIQMEVQNYASGSHISEQVYAKNRVANDG